MNTNDEPFWKRIYKQHPRHRAYALTLQGEHDLENLWRACNQDTETFNFALEELTDCYGLNILRPVARAKPQPPEPRKDREGKELPNPWEFGDLIGTPADQVRELPPHLQRAYRDQRALIKHEPELAKDLRERAAHPYEYAMRLEAEERAIEEWNEAEAAYSEESHRGNLLLDASATKTEKAHFYNRLLMESRAKAAISLREMSPVEVGLFEPIKVDPMIDKMVEPKNREKILQVYHDGNHRLVKIIEAGQLREKTLRIEAAEKMEAERQAAAKLVMKGEAKLRDVMSGVRRLVDGRLITQPGR